MNTLVAALLILLMLAAILVLLAVGLFWLIFQRPQARLSGEVRLAGLASPTEIVRDRYGVPHIDAETQSDVFFAQGFVHAQDRLFQMDYGRRLAQGAMAEVFGAAALEADRWSRVLGFWRAAKQDLEALEPAEVALLEAYAAGANAFIDQQRTNLPAEFKLLGYQPAPWTALDSLGLLKIMGWGLSGNWEGELLRLQLLQLLGPERVMELEPLYPANAPTSVPGAGQIDGQALTELAGRLRQSYAAASQWLGGDGLMGSNSWVLAPDRTTTRRPLLASDPHLSVSMPNFWYENHLHTADGLHVSGAGMPGVPGVMIGHNERIGWGITAGRTDNQDLFIELRHPEEATWFRHDGEWEAATVFKEEIRVRGRPEPHLEPVVLTRHGPLINGLVERGFQRDGSLEPEVASFKPEGKEEPALALRWAGQEPSLTFRGLLALLRASDWASFRAALAWVGEPTLNVTYADVQGNIGYQYVARVPRRGAGSGMMPAAGWEAGYEWQGLLPFEDLPGVLNPVQGYAVTANNRPAPDAYPHYLGVDWYPGYRATRIERMLQAKPRYTPRDFQRMQLDVHSVQAESLVPYLIMIDSDNPFERRIIRELEAWNLRVDVDSFAAAAYEVARLHLLELVFGDKLGLLFAGYLGKTHSEIFTSSAFAGKAGLCLVNLLEQEESWWFHDAASGQLRTRDQLLRLAIQRTALTLQEMIGKDPRKWAWGKVHQINFTHLLGRVRLLRTIFNRGQYPIGGDEHTVWMTAYDLRLPFGLVTTTATFRMVLDVGDWDRAMSIIPTGQSGQPGSRHYADQFDMWREGELHPMPWSREAVKEAAVHRLWLRPADGEQ